MKNIMLASLLLALTGCDSQDTTNNPPASSSTEASSETIQLAERIVTLPGGARIAFSNKIILDEIAIVNGRNVRKIAVDLHGVDVVTAEQFINEILSSSNYTRRLTSEADNALRVFYKEGENPGIDSYFVKLNSTQKNENNSTVRLVMAWPVK